MENSIGMERTMSGPIGSKALLEALKPILRLKRFSGRSINWPSEDEPKHVRWAYTIIDLVVTVLTLSFVVHCAHYFSYSELNTSQFLVGLALMLIYLSASLLCCINIIARLTSGHNLIRQVQSYQVISGRDVFTNLEKINCRLLWLFLITLLAVIIIISTLFLTSAFSKESIQVRMLMFSNHDGLEFSIGVFNFALISFFIGSGQLCDFWILVFFCRVFSWEFRSLHDKWLRPGGKTSNDVQGLWYLEIDTFRREYEQVVGLVKAVERTFRFDLLLYFGVIIPVTCVSIYAILQPEDIEEADLIIMQISASVVAVQCCLFIFVGVKINSSVSMTYY